jgi:magnesium-transporting ATPase (P-type)
MTYSFHTNLSVGLIQPSSILVSPFCLYVLQYPFKCRNSHPPDQLLVIIVSATFYAVVDFHASRIMKSIKSLIADEATVVRDGEQRTISSTDIVVGDLVALQMGNRVPADLRITNASSDLRFDRSLLTGER